MNFEDKKAYSVTAITRLIKNNLEESFRSIWVEGEVSGYIHHSSGHRYLSLKDDNAVIKVTIWRSVGQSLTFEPENGMKVRIYGDISVYAKGGNYQLNARKLTPLGVGELEIAFRQLYEKLSKEGLFESDRKKNIPAYPKKIGIVTSPTGAAVRDIINIATRRNDTVQLLLYPAKVQGAGAELTVVKGIEYFNSRDDIECIIVGRGGGSLEDLWCFNEEILVRAIAASDIPIVSGVGHEIDTTLSDLASDLRAPTPSAAAEIVVWNKRDLLERLEYYKSQINYMTDNLIEEKRQAIRQIMNRPVYRRPESIIEMQQQYLDNLSRRLDSSGKNLLEVYKNRLSLFDSRLNSLSPLAVLKRGYAVVRDSESGQVVKSADSLEKGALIEAILSEGSAIAKVESINKND